MKFLLVLGLLGLTTVLAQQPTAAQDRAARAREASRRRRRQLAELELEEQIAQEELQA